MAFFVLAIFNQFEGTNTMHVVSAENNVEALKKAILEDLNSHCKDHPEIFETNKEFVDCLPDDVEQILCEAANCEMNITHPLQISSNPIHVST